MMPASFFVEGSQNAFEQQPELLFPLHGIIAIFV